MRYALFYFVVAAATLFLVLALCVCIVGWLVWHSGLASFSMRKDIARIWIQIRAMRAGILGGIGLLAVPLLIHGALRLFVGVDQQRWDVALAGGGMLAISAVLITLILRNA